MNSGTFDNLQRLLPEFYKALGETLVMVGVSAAFAVVAGGALGILLFASARGQVFARPGLNGVLNWLVSYMRAFPFVILMIVLMPLTRAIVGTSFGPLAASVSLSIAASFYFARLVEQNLNEVPKGVIEAAQAMGAKPGTIILKVLVNEARAGLIGGGGIGDLGIRYGHQRYMKDVMAAVVSLLSVIVILVQSTGNRLSKHLDKR